MESMRLKHWLVLLLTAILLGSSFAQIKLALDGLSPMTLAALRAAIAAPLVWAFLRLQGGRLPRSGSAWTPLVLVGLLGAAIPFAAIAWGQERIASGLGGILFGTIPVISVVIAPLFIHEERFAGKRLVGAMLGFGGVVIVTGTTALGGHNGVAGIAVTLLAALSYALSAIYARRQTQLSPPVLAAGQLIVATALLLPLALLVEAPPQTLPAIHQLAAVAGLGLLSTALPVVLLFWLVRESGATNASMVALFIPVVAVALGALLLGEGLPADRLLGLVLVLIGAWIISRAGQQPEGARWKNRLGSEA